MHERLLELFWRHYDRFGWQSRFYDRIIRDEEELNKIRKYIIENPANWIRDKDNTEGLFM